MLQGYPRLHDYTIGRAAMRQPTRASLQTCTDFQRPPRDSGSNRSHTNTSPTSQRDIRRGRGRCGSAGASHCVDASWVVRGLGPTPGTTMPTGRPRPSLEPRWDAGLPIPPPRDQARPRARGAVSIKPGLSQPAHTSSRGGPRTVPDTRHVYPNYAFSTLEE